MDAAWLENLRLLGGPDGRTFSLANDLIRVGTNGSPSAPSPVNIVDELERAIQFLEVFSAPSL